MTGIKVELANPHQFTSPREYIEKHLAPAVTELHRITNELLSPGATSAEDWQTDMVPAPAPGPRFVRFDRPLYSVSKHVTFDGSEYFSIPPELLRAKQLKVQFTAAVYANSTRGRQATVQFRLVDEQGDEIINSTFETDSQSPVTLSTVVPFGESRGCVHPSKITYYIEGRTPSALVMPVCRRFSLAFVYI